MDCRSYESDLDNRMKQTIRARRKRHLTQNTSIRVKNLSIWSFWFGNVWLLWRVVAA